VRGTARLNDKTFGVCSHPSHPTPITIGGRIVTASSNTLCNNRPAARLGDTVLSNCGHIGKICTAATSENYDRKSGTARLNDKTTGVYKARIITASSNTFPNPES